MTRLLLTTAALVAIAMTGAANAADLPLPPPVYRAPPPPAVYNWTGCYVAGGVGYAMWNDTNFVDWSRRLPSRSTTAAGAGTAWGQRVATINSACRSARSGAQISSLVPSQITEGAAIPFAALSAARRAMGGEDHALDLGCRRSGRLPGDAEVPVVFRWRLHPGEFQQRKPAKSHLPVAR